MREPPSTRTGDRLLPDGGRYTETLYAWYDPDTGGLLYHTEANGEYADPFFDEETEARDFLERQADLNGKEDYENLSLRKLKAKKIGEAVEVLTEQAGFEDFIADGGHQIDNPQLDRLWFWYDPAADRIVQREVEPYNVVGLFEHEDDADWFIRAYAGFYDEDISHFEKYSAELEYQGQGPVLDAEESERSEGATRQAGFGDVLDETFADKNPELKHLDPDEWNDDDEGGA